MNKNNNEIFILENYENEFSYKKSKSNLNITFNRICIYFFYISYDICLIYSIKVTLFRLFEF